MRTNSINTYEKQVIIVNAYNHIVDLFGRKHELADTPYSVFSDIVEDYTTYLENIESSIEGDNFINEKSKRIVLKHMDDAENLLLDDNADSLSLYPIKRAIRVAKDMKVVEEV